MFRGGPNADRIGGQEALKRPLKRRDGLGKLVAQQDQNLMIATTPGHGLSQRQRITTNATMFGRRLAGLKVNNNSHRTVQETVKACMVSVIDEILVNITNLHDVAV